jgi:tetratricopeptide (TPR) repeat protein
VLGAAYERDDRFDLAERTFREVIGFNPFHAETLNYLGYMLADRGQKLEEALAFIQRAVIIDTDNPSYRDSLGWAYFKLGRFEQARPSLEQAAAALPRTSLIQDHLGDLYAQLRRFRDAADAWDRALTGDRQGIDPAAVTRKRDRARQQAGGSD